MRGVKGVFDPFWGFWENGQNWPSSSKKGKIKKNIKKLIIKWRIQESVEKGPKIGGLKKGVFLTLFEVNKKVRKKTKNL